MLQIAWSTDISEQRMMLYVNMLSDVNPVTLEQAIANLINKCKFLPTIAEIREECTALSAYVNMHDEVETAQTAWEKVIKVAGTYGYDNGKEHLEGITLQAAKPIWSSFDPRMGHEYNEASCRAQFIKCYEQLIDREKHRQRMANSIKDNHLLLKAREKAEHEKSLISAGQKQIEMTRTGNLVEVAKEPVDVTEIINKSKISDKGKALLKQAIVGQMKERVKEFDVSVNVNFNVSFQVMATSEAQARTKIENLLEIMRNEATVDCHIHPNYDVFVDEVDAELNQISYW